MKALLLASALSAGLLLSACATTGSSAATDLQAVQLGYNAAVLVVNANLGKLSTQQQTLVAQAETAVQNAIANAQKAVAAGSTLSQAAQVAALGAAQDALVDLLTDLAADGLVVQNVTITNPVGAKAVRFAAVHH